MKITAHSARAYLAHLSALETLGAPDGETAYKALRRIEARAGRAALRYCNGEIETEEMDRAAGSAARAAAKVFGGKLPPGFHVNQDPRGYALKIQGPEAGSPGYPVPAGLQTDWGKNGILAPSEF